MADTPIIPNINARNIRGKNLREAAEINGSHQVSGVVLYISRMTIANPTPSKVVPNRTKPNHRLTPNPGTSQRVKGKNISLSHLYNSFLNFLTIPPHHSNLFYPRQLHFFRKYNIQVQL
jgi:hypothetical protein